MIAYASQDTAHDHDSRREEQLRNVAFKAARVATLHAREPSRSDYLHFVPAVTNAQELADLSARVNWYLPGVEVPVYVHGASGVVVDPEDAPHMDPSLVRDPGWASTQPRGTPLWVYWRLGKGEVRHFLRHARHAEIVDWTLYFVSDSTGWARLLARYCTPPRAGSAGLKMLFDKKAIGSSALVLGTGPSATLLDPSEIDADVRILCNSAVRDRQLVRELQPDAIAFADPVFHFSPNWYAASFRADLLRTLDETNAVCIVQEQWANILLSQHPELLERTAVIEADRRAPFRWPSVEDPRVRATGNILTALMLPVAAALADTIYVGGCDGRQPDEGYFWKHNQRIQYSGDHMKAAFDAHPAFFRHADYGQYYEEHCGTLEVIARLAESDGKQVKAVTPSWIPALRERGAPPFRPEQ